MNIDKWDLFSICESLLIVSDKPVTVEQVVEALLREQEAELERLEEEADAELEAQQAPPAPPVYSVPGFASSGFTPESFANAATLANDPAFSVGLRSPNAASQLDAEDGRDSDTDEHLDAGVATDVADAQQDSAAAAFAPAPRETRADETDDVVEESKADAEPALPVTAHTEDTTVDGDASHADTSAVSTEADTQQELFVESEAAAPPKVQPSAETLAQKRAAEEARRQALVRRELGKLVQDAFDALVAAYADERRPLARGFSVVAIAGAYQLRTNPLCAPFVRHHLQVKPAKLSRAQLETLAIVAYRQPVTRPEIEQIRGVDCGAAMKILIDKRLVRILGKKEEVGRPLLYGTSKEFLEFFKLSTLLELPTLREFQELTEEHKRQVEEELEAEAPLGNLRDLVEEGTATFQHDDTALIADLDTALTGVKDTVNRVAELTGLKAHPEDETPPTDPNQNA